MKKIILSLILAVILISNGFGKTVDVNRAKKVASNYLSSMPGQYPQWVSGSLTLSHSAVENTTSGLTKSSIPLFYVFNITGSHGFIIISADDIIPPVLAYSNESSFSADNIPPNVEAWLKGYEDQISYAIRTNINQVPGVRSLWNSLNDGPLPGNQLKSAAGVNPLITSKWDQSPFYNDLCPYDNTASKRTPTGCVATAMAMVMKYYKYPTTGIGSYSFSTNNYGTLSANFGATTYKWDSMPNSVTSANSAVATLMYHCGVSVKMGYTASSSSAWILASDNTKCAENALKENFGYANTLQGVEKKNYSDTSWINLLKTELNASRPMVYGGEGTGGGHCFVCDGYDNTDKFHFNWGWGGSYDGYFLLTNLVPEGTGTGGGSGSYTSGQEAIIGIRKPSSSGGGNRFFKLALNAPVTCPADTINYEDSLSFHTDIINNGQFIFSGDISACIFDTNGIFINEVQTIKGIALAPGSHLPNGATFTNPGLTSMLPNTYFVGIMYRSSDTNWIIVPDTNTFRNNKRLVVINSTPIEMYSTMIISPGLYIKQGDSVSVKADIVNHGTTDFNGTLDLSIYDMEGYYVNFIGEKTNFTLPVNQHTMDLTFSTQSINVQPGSYLIALLYQPAGSSDWQLIGSSSYANPVKIQVNATPLVADQYEPNNTSQAATALPVSFSTNPAIIKTEGANCHEGTDFDFYSLSLPAGFTYIISGNLVDAYNDSAQVYTLDALWSWSTNGTTWSEPYDDTIPDITMNNGGTIIFHVAPYFPGQTGTYQSTLRISRNPLGVRDQISPDELRVYPNPVNDYLFIETANQQAVISGVKLFSITGRELAAMNFTELQSAYRMPVSEIQAGTYILAVTTANGIIHRQIVIRRK